MMSTTGTDGHQVNLVAGRQHHRGGVTTWDWRPGCDDHLHGGGQLAVRPVTRRCLALSLDVGRAEPGLRRGHDVLHGQRGDDVANTTVMATTAHADATVDAPAGQIDLAEGGITPSW